MVYIKKGMFLTEVLVALFLFSLLSVFIMRFIVTSTISLIEINKKNDQIATLTSALDWVMRDVHNLDNANINIETNGSFKLSNAMERLTWKLQNEKLIRVSQRYNSLAQEWKKPYSCLVAQNVSEITFERIEQKNTASHKVQGIHCTLVGSLSEKQTLTVSQYVALRNGVL